MQTWGYLLVALASWEATAGGSLPDDATIALGNLAANLQAQDRMDPGRPGRALELQRPVPSSKSMLLRCTLAHAAVR